MDRVVGKTKHGELTLDEIAGLQPGMSELMIALTHRANVMYYACKAENWSLGLFQLRGMRKILANANLTRPKYREALAEFSKAHLDPVEGAIKQKSWEEFQRAMAAMVEASDRYHSEFGYGYIRYRVPAAPPAGYFLPPPEGEGR
jgi:hypothetical protein